MIIAVRTVLVTLLVVGHVLAERFFALFTGKHHLGRPRQSMVLRFLVALGAIEPLLAAWRAYGDLCVQDVFAANL